MTPLDTISDRPLSQPTIDAVFAAAHAVNALPVEVHWRGRIHEIGVWQHGEWIGSVFRWPNAEGLAAWCSVGNQCIQAHSPDDAVRKALWGTDFRHSQKPQRRTHGAQSSGRVSVAADNETPPTRVCVE